MEGNERANSVADRFQDRPKTNKAEDYPMVRSQTMAASSSVKYFVGHPGVVSARNLWAMTRSTGVLPSTASAVTLAALPSMLIASRLTEPTPVICRSALPGFPPGELQVFCTHPGAVVPCNPCARPQDNPGYSHTHPADCNV